MGCLPPIEPRRGKRELRAEGRGSSYRLLRTQAKPVHSGAHYPFQDRRDRHLNRPVQTPGALAPDKRSGFQQGEETLLEEKRVAIGTLCDRLEDIFAASSLTNDLASWRSASAEAASSIHAEPRTEAGLQRRLQRVHAGVGFRPAGQHHQQGGVEPLGATVVR